MNSNIMLNDLKQAGFSHVISFFNKNKDKRLVDILDDIFTTKNQCSSIYKDRLIHNALLFCQDNVKDNIKDSLIGYVNNTDTLLCANHAGLENHPMLIASTLLCSIYFAKKGINALPLCACSTINPSNATKPTSLFLDTRRESNFQHHSFRITPQSLDKSPLLCLNAPAFNDYNKLLQRSNNLNIDPNIKAKLFKSIVNLKEHAKTLSQCNSMLYLLHTFNTQIYRSYISPYLQINPIFIPQELLVSDLLLSDLDNTDSFISKTLTSQDLFLKLLHSLSGKSDTWSCELLDCDNNDPDIFKRSKGSVLFYYLENSRLKPLKLCSFKSTLYLCDGAQEFKLDRSSLMQYLKDRVLIPNLYLCYSSLYFEHKVRTAGGIFMTNYLKNMLYKTASVLSLPLHDNFFLDNIISAVVLPFMVAQKSNQRRPLYLLDMIESHIDKNFLDTLLDRPLNDFFEQTATEMIYDFTSRDTILKHCK